MKVTCDREALLSAFQTASAVVPSRSPKPILQNIKLEVDEKGAILLATDPSSSVLAMRTHSFGTRRMACAIFKRCCPKTTASI